MANEFDLTAVGIFEEFLGYPKTSGGIRHRLLPCGQIAPKPVFYLVAAWSAGRVMHQLGYVHGYGKHAPGFMLTTFSALALEGICALVALEGFGVPILGEYL